MRLTLSLVHLTLPQGQLTLPLVPLIRPLISHPVPLPFLAIPTLQHEELRATQQLGQGALFTPWNIEEPRL